jgi:chromosome partitioning protein
MRSVAFVNKKGGVGKSSCVMHLGIRFARMGLRTLLVDVDPQASLSQGLLGREALAIHPSETLASLYEGIGIPMAALARPGGRENLAIVPGHDRMMLFNTPAPWDAGPEQFALRDMLAEVEGDYDLCLLDCPPHVMLCAWSALLAADGVVVPAQLEDFGVQGVAAILDTIEQARDLANPRLRLIGILPTMFDRRLSIHQSYRDNAAEAFGPDLFAEVVPAATDFKVAVTLRKGVTEHKPRGEASKALCRVADEILERLDGRCGGRHGAGGFGVGRAAKGVA